MHLVIDGYGGDVEKMWDQQLVRDFLDQFPAKLAMTPITKPQVLKYVGDNAEDAGFLDLLSSPRATSAYIPFPAANTST